MVAVAGTALSISRVSLAQPGAQLNPVYVDDSPTATDTLVRVQELLGAKNVDEAVRVLQVLLDEQGDHVIASAADPDVFVGVRARVNALIVSSPELLAGYRRLIGPRAEGEIAWGRFADVERSMLLTASGFESALRVAQGMIEDARFEAARQILDQLLEHPDNTGDGAARLARLYSLLAGYLDRPAVRARAAELAARAKLDAAPPAPVNWPVPALERGRSALDELPALRIPELISKPLWTASLGQPTPARDASTPAPGFRSTAVPIPTFERELSMLPTVQGDWVFVNDGTSISAWDRFTLTPRWSITPASNGDPVPPVNNDDMPFRNGRMRNIYANNSQRTDDAASVSVAGRMLIAAVGRAAVGGNARDGDDRIIGVDVPTGKLRWSISLRNQDASVADGVVRGPIIITEGTAIAAIRKYMPERRLMSLAFLGLDLRSGATKWVRPVASTGQMPWLAPPSGTDALLLAEGVVYRTDRLGVVAAVEAGSGRVVWVRRANVETGNSQGDTPVAWPLSQPVLDGDSIIAIAPDGKRVERLDRQTGKVLTSRDAKQLGDPCPLYLLRVQDKLACVDDTRIRFVDIAKFETGIVTTSRPIDDPGIRGRVSLVGGKLLAPTITGALVIDPENAEREPQQISLEESGNILALDNQLVVVDDARLHSYLLWDVAEGLLTERMRADPKNPAPAVTFAELAYRAGKPDKIAAAVDAAMSALRDTPSGEASQLTRQRLFEALHSMLNQALEFDVQSGHRAPGLKPITDDGLLRVLGERLGELAQTPDEKLAFALASGRLAERANDAAQAAARYQTVLSEPALGAATWRGPAALVRGELEAARRIESLIARHGANVYAVEEGHAAAELAALGPSPTIDQLEAMALRYPVASLTPGIWLKISELDRAADKPNQAASALDAGIRTSQRVANPDLKVVGELAGRLITELRERKQVVGAASVLRTIRGKFPQATLTAAGQPLDAEKLGADLADKLAATMRWPRVGAVRTDNSQAMPGWLIMQPLLRDGGPNVSPLLALERDEEIGLWSPPVLPGKGEDDAQLVRSWSFKLEGREAKLIKTTSDAAYFLVSDGQGEAAVHKVLAGEGKDRWTSQPTSKLFAWDDARGLQRVPGGVADSFNTPAGGAATGHDLIIAMDDRTLVILQRSGRAAGIDVETGETLWSSRTLVSRAYDADLVGGVLAVAGDQEVVGAGNGALELRPTVQAIEARTGRGAQRIGDLSSHPRWIKLADNGAALIGLDQTVVCVDMGTGQTNWTMAGPENQPIDAAWVFGDQAVMLSPTRNLYFGSISSGRVRPQPLEVPKNHMERTHQLEVFPLTSAPKSGFGVATNQGLAIFNGEGELVGVDGLGGDDVMVPPKPAEGRILTTQTFSDGRAGDGLLMFQMHTFDSTNAALLENRPVLLGARPLEMVLMDGRIALSAGNVTAVLSAPVARK